MEEKLFLIGPIVTSIVSFFLLRSLRASEISEICAVLGFVAAVLASMIVSFVYIKLRASALHLYGDAGLMIIAVSGQTAVASIPVAAVFVTCLNSFKNKKAKQDDKVE